MTTTALVDATTGKIDLTDALSASDEICFEAPIFVMETEADGSLTGYFYEADTAASSGKTITLKAAETGKPDPKGRAVMVDYYVVKKSANISEIQIDAENFAGYYYVEADTLFRRQSDGVDMPANITIPNVKIQSNFTFSMASSGDPSEQMRQAA